VAQILPTLPETKRAGAPHQAPLVYSLAANLGWIFSCFGPHGQPVFVFAFRLV
jgi:hypothetical protein